MTASDGDMTVTVKHQSDTSPYLVAWIALCMLGCFWVGWTAAMRRGLKEGAVAGVEAGIKYGRAVSKPEPPDRWTRFRLSGGAQVAVDPDGTIEAHCPDDGFKLKGFGEPFIGKPRNDH